MWRCPESKCRTPCTSLKRLKQVSWAAPGLMCPWSCSGRTTDAVKAILVPFPVALPFGFVTHRFFAPTNAKPCLLHASRLNKACQSSVRIDTLPVRPCFLASKMPLHFQSHPLPKERSCGIASGFFGGVSPLKLASQPLPVQGKHPKQNDSKT